MKVRIHRGAHEIGGSCVELESDGARLVLDVGWPLELELGADPPLPAVPGLASGDDPDLLGVLISHPHLDHWGLLSKVHPDVPVFIGEDAARILRESAFFSPAGADLSPAGFLHHERPLDLGPFRITPLLADHSAFDAYSLLIEAGGRRLFYSGDLRGHGRKRTLFDRLVQHPPPDVDVLLLEGTVIHPDGGSRSGPDEDDVERALWDEFLRTEGLALVAFSPQNVDRLVSVYKAARDAGRVFVTDLYAHTVARATGNRKIPQAGHPHLRVYVQQRHRVKIKNAGETWRVDDPVVKRARIYPKEIAANPAGHVMLFRTAMIRDVEYADALGDALLVWSMWEGYLKKEPTRSLIRDFTRRHGIRQVGHHASGHASVADLGRVVDAFATARVVPIHTFGASRFEDHFPRVEVRGDGEWWSV